MLVSYSVRASSIPIKGMLILCATVICGTYLTYHNELRNKQQSGWQIFGRSDYHINAFQNRRAELLAQITLHERRQFRVLPASADVFTMQRGRNWKLVAETELLAADGFNVLYSYRELEHPFIGALYSTLYPSFAPSNFFPPLSEAVGRRIPVLRTLGVGYVLSADAHIDSDDLEYRASITTDAPPFHETAAHGELHLYKLNDALPVVWLAPVPSSPSSNQEALRILIKSPTDFSSLFPASPSELDGQAIVVQETPQAVVVETKTEQPSQLVATWVYRRFWQAYLDGHRVPIKRSHGVFMEVDVPAVTGYAFSSHSES